MESYQELCYYVHGFPWASNVPHLPHCLSPRPNLGIGDTQALERFRLSTSPSLQNGDGMHNFDFLLYFSLPYACQCYDGVYDEREGIRTGPE